MLIVHLLKLVLVCYSSTAVGVSNSQFKCFVAFATRRPPFAYRIALSPRFPGVVVVSNKKNCTKVLQYLPAAIAGGERCESPVDWSGRAPSFPGQRFAVGLLFAEPARPPSCVPAKPAGSVSDAR